MWDVNKQIKSWGGDTQYIGYAIRNKMAKGVDDSRRVSILQCDDTNLGIEMASLCL